MRKLIRDAGNTYGSFWIGPDPAAAVAAKLWERLALPVEIVMVQSGYAHPRSAHKGYVYALTLPGDDRILRVQATVYATTRLAKEEVAQRMITANPHLKEVLSHDVP